MTNESPPIKKQYIFQNMRWFKNLCPTGWMGGWSLPCSPQYTVPSVFLAEFGEPYRCPCLCFLLLFLHCCTWPCFILLDGGDEKRGGRGLPLSQCLVHEDKPAPSRSSGFSTSRSLSWPLVAEILQKRKIWPTLIFSWLLLNFVAGTHNSLITGGLY